MEAHQLSFSKVNQKTFSSQKCCWYINYYYYFDLAVNWRNKKIKFVIISNRWQWNTRIFPVTKILYPVKIQCFTVHLFHVNTSRPSRFHQSKPIGNYHNSFTFFLLNFLHILRGIHISLFYEIAYVFIAITFRINR